MSAFQMFEIAAALLSLCFLILIGVLSHFFKSIQSDIKNIGAQLTEIREKQHQSDTINAERMNENMSSVWKSMRDVKIDIERMKASFHLTFPVWGGGGR